MQQTETHPDSALPGRLDDLVGLDESALLDLYRAGRTPALAALDGDLRGRFLAVRAVRGPLAGVLRSIARSAWFPWRGKTFRADGERGEGRNVLVGGRRAVPFTTSIGPSRAGAFDAVHLDYDRRDNPPGVRAIHDELREVGPGVYLGLGYVVLRGEPRLVLFFGLER